MKKLYIQPEFDLLKLSSTEDILQNSLEEKAEISDITDQNGQDVNPGDLRNDFDEDEIVEESGSWM